MEWKLITFAWNELEMHTFTDTTKITLRLDLRLDRPGRTFSSPGSCQWLGQEWTICNLTIFVHYFSNLLILYFSSYQILSFCIHVLIFLKRNRVHLIWPADEHNQFFKNSQKFDFKLAIFNQFKLRVTNESFFMWAKHSIIRLIIICCFALKIRQLVKWDHREVNTFGESKRRNYVTQIILVMDLSNDTLCK